MKKDKSDKKRQFVSPLTSANIRKSGGPINSERKITRSHGTIAAYLRRAQQIISMMTRKSGISDPSLADVVSWIIDRSATQSPSTIRLYRASLCCYIESQFHAGIISETELNTLLNALSTMKSTLPNKSALTSSKKAKCANHDVIQRLIGELNKSSGEYAKLAALLFMGSLIAGLRPVEWKDATLHRDESSGDATLTVYNAKTTNGRSFGATRRLYIPKARAGLIEQVINEVSAALKLSSWDKIYGSCRKSIQRTGIKSRNKNVSLYTARHQFIANMKNIYSREEVALLVGHASIETAAIHYGKRYSGHPEFKNHVGLAAPQPAPGV